MDDMQKKLLVECVESHERMIKFHRKQIIEIRRILNQVEITMEPLEINIKNDTK